MVVTTAQTVDVSQVLSAALAGVDGLRVEAFVSDKARPPCAVVALPTIDWTDQDSGFCFARWDFPVTIVTARNDPKSSQDELSRLVRDVANALKDYDLSGSGVFSIEPLDARPTIAAIAGLELPAYIVRVAVRA
jgi:hypothetical protein